MDKQWKARERQAVRTLGAERLPSNGKAAPDALADVAGQQLALEHKSRESLPAWLTDAMAQATRNAPTGSLPVVLLTAGAGTGKPNHRLAVLRLADLPALLAALGEHPDSSADVSKCKQRKDQHP